MTLAQARVACAKKKAEMLGGDTLTKKEKADEQKRQEMKSPAFEDVWELAVDARERESGRVEGGKAESAMAKFVA